MARRQLQPEATTSQAQASQAHAIGSFNRMWADLHLLGRDAVTGGYHRFAWTTEDAQLREWFAGQAAARRMDLVTDRNGNQWAWWGNPDDHPAAGLVIGSHLDSVPSGGAFDGPLGVVSAFAVVDALRARGFSPDRPIAVANFVDEEGARFGIACAGSRLLTGALDPDRARRLTDRDGTTLAEAAAAAGHDVRQLGRDEEVLDRIGTFVELHIEQGRGLVDLGRPLAVGTEIWPHGRWRFDLQGRADHAGTTRLKDRQDPMLDLARLVQTVRATAERHQAVATVGKITVSPGAVNAIASGVTAWLDARGRDEHRVQAMLEELRENFGTVAEESWTPATGFDPELATELSDLVGGDSPAPLLSTGAGHDAGVLAGAGIQTAMLFVRNPTGTSHSPEEFAEEDDCHAGVEALTRVVAHLASGR